MCACPPCCMQAVLVPTEVMPETPVIRGHDFDKGCDIDSIMASMLTTGFQAQALGQSVNEINKMVRACGPASFHSAASLHVCMRIAHRPACKPACPTLLTSPLPFPQCTPDQLAPE